MPLSAQERVVARRTQKKMLTDLMKSTLPANVQERLTTVITMLQSQGPKSPKVRRLRRGELRRILNKYPHVVPLYRRYAALWNPEPGRHDRWYLPVFQNVKAVELKDWNPTVEEEDVAPQPAEDEVVIDLIGSSEEEERVIDLTGDSEENELYEDDGHVEVIPFFEDEEVGHENMGSLHKGKDIAILEAQRKIIEEKGVNTTNDILPDALNRIEPDDGMIDWNQTGMLMDNDLIEALEANRALKSHYLEYLATRPIHLVPVKNAQPTVPSNRHGFVAWLYHRQQRFPDAAPLLSECKMLAIRLGRPMHEVHEEIMRRWAMEHDGIFGHMVRQNRLLDLGEDPDFNS